MRGSKDRRRWMGTAGQVEWCGSLVVGMIDGGREV